MDAKSSWLLQSPQQPILIHWKGEPNEGYTRQFRHGELHGAMAAILNCSVTDLHGHLQWHDALLYAGPASSIPYRKVLGFNQAMQYVTLDINNNNTTSSMRRAMTRQDWIHIAQRCALVHAMYEIVADAISYSELLPIVMNRDGFNDMWSGQENEHASWCIRVRQYGDGTANEGKLPRSGSRAGSLRMEQEALTALQPLLIKFAGKVDLRNPDCAIYLFDGLQPPGHRKVLGRRLAVGPSVTVIAPNTRLCKTNTPLCPIAAFLLCNIGCLQTGMSILDPFAGSGSILLAAAMIEPSCQTVGIEIAHNGLVNRTDILRDFDVRGLPRPVALLRGDSSDAHVRAQARKALADNNSINNRHSKGQATSALSYSSFDLILTDPPYGIRESTSSEYATPLHDLFHAIAVDREAGTPLLRRGTGRLVCFVPYLRPTDELPVNVDMMQVLPTQEQQDRAGLKCEYLQEQPLNDKLSRWLVVYRCIE